MLRTDVLKARQAMLDRTHSMVGTHLMRDLVAAVPVPAALATVAIKGFETVHAARLALEKQAPQLHSLRGVSEHVEALQARMHRLQAVVWSGRGVLKDPSASADATGDSESGADMGAGAPAPAHADGPAGAAALTQRIAVRAAVVEVLRMAPTPLRPCL